MTILDDIQESIAPELSRLNECISATLATGNELMNTIVSNYLKTKGKQIRPILVILSARMLGEVNGSTISAAASIEMLHNATLIHDDVVDDTDTRRGKPTINAIWDNHVAVLVGDFFVSSSLQRAIDTGDFRIIATISELGRVLSLGEIDQIDKARAHDLDEDAYINIISSKTASLFEACIRMGGYSVGASDENIARLESFARLFGLCFQIRDDIFDYYDSKEVGKPTGNDLREGKITLPLIHALGRTGHPRCHEMRRIASSDTLSQEDITTLIEYAKEAGGIDYAYDYMHALRDKAAATLAEFPASPTRDTFMKILDYVIARRH